MEDPVVHRCPVHHTFKFWDKATETGFKGVPACDYIVRTTEFARLKNLKQLGFTHHVYEGAEHSRFPHSLGVAHLARTLVETLRSSQPDLHIEQCDVRRVTIAGLCHDLGHGPFSHTFEKDVLPRLHIPHGTWHHEEMSCKILDLIVEQIPDVPDVTPDKDDINAIKQMIDSKLQTGGAHQNGVSSSRDKRFLFDIVSNHKNSIDVDKWDYLARDSLYCHHKISFNFEELLHSCKVLGGEICWHRDRYGMLHEMFRSRERLHREVYMHKKVHAINLMVADALVEANKVFDYRDMVLTAPEFIQLDDSVLQQIQHVPKHLQAVLKQDTVLSTALTKAQELLRRVQCGQLYTYINEVHVPTKHINEGKWKVPTEDELISYYPNNGTLRLEDYREAIVLSTTNYDFAMKGENPMDKVYFYETEDCTKGMRMQQAHASQMLPSNFQETSLRLFCKSQNQQVIDAAETAFKNWTEKRFGSDACLQQRTPVKQRVPQLSASAAASTQKTGTASVGSVQLRRTAAVAEMCSTPTSNAKRARTDASMEPVQESG